MLMLYRKYILCEHCYTLVVLKQNETVCVKNAKLTAFIK